MRCARRRYRSSCSWRSAVAALFCASRTSRNDDNKDLRSGAVVTVSCILSTDSYSYSKLKNISVACEIYYYKVWRFYLKTSEINEIRLRNKIQIKIQNHTTSPSTAQTSTEDIDKIENEEMSNWYHKQATMLFSYHRAQKLIVVILSNITAS